MPGDEERQDALDKRDLAYQKRLKELEQREAALREREEELKAREEEKKQVLLRIPRSLWSSLARWADHDLRSINGQIEYLLTKAVREREKKKRDGCVDNL